MRFRPNHRRVLQGATAIAVAGMMGIAPAAAAEQKPGFTFHYTASSVEPGHLQVSSSAPDTGEEDSPNLTDEEALKKVAENNKHYSANHSKGTNRDDTVRWVDRLDNSDIVIVAPHAVKNKRFGRLKPADAFTGGIAETVADQLGASLLAQDGITSNWDGNWKHRDTPFVRQLNALPKDKIIVDLHGMSNKSSKGDISVGTSEKDTGATRKLANRVRKAFAGDTVIDGKFKARKHYTVTKHMQKRGNDSVQIEMSHEFRSPKEEKVGHTVNALITALKKTEEQDRSSAS